MKDYYNGFSKGRLDDIYSYVDGSLIRNHNLWNESIHIDENQNIRDIAGEYVLLSDDFIYMGQDAVDVDVLKEHAPPFRGTKLWEGKIAEMLIKACEKYRDGKIHKPNTPIKRSKCT